MILKDILNKPYEYITYRMMININGELSDEFIGCCKYDGINLISLDGDTYSFDDEIDKYEIKNNELIVWEKEQIKMAIKIKFDKKSEQIWLREILNCGCLNLSKESIEDLEKHNISTTQDVEFIKSENFKNDIVQEMKNNENYFTE